MAPIAGGIAKGEVLCASDKRRRISISQYISTPDTHWTSKYSDILTAQVRIFLDYVNTINLYRGSTVMRGFKTGH